MTQTSAIARLGVVVFDAPDLETERDFWTGLLEASVRDSEDDWITLDAGAGWDLAFQLAPDLVPPQWPSAERPQQMHLDVRVLDLGEATEKALGLGATLLRENAAWNTLADPAGHPFDLCVNAEVGDPLLWAVTYDVPDASAAASFWSRVLGQKVAYDQDNIAMLEGERPVLFQGVEAYTAPQWPDPAKPQQGHLDLVVADLDAGEKAVLDIGASRLPGGGQTFRVFADPAGHPFCLCLS